MINLIPVITNPVIDKNVGNLLNYPNFNLGAVLPGGSGGPAADAAYIIQLFVVNFIRLGFIAGSVIFLFMIIWGAIEYIIAGGDKEKTGNAQKRITNGLIGMGILLSAFAIAALARVVFGINLLLLDIPIIK